MEIKLKQIMDWLKDSGMKVNVSKTDLCLFHRGDTTLITLNLYGKSINAKLNKLPSGNLVFTWIFKNVVTSDIKEE